MVKGTSLDGKKVNPGYKPSFYTPLNATSIANCKNNFHDPTKSEETLTCMEDGTLKWKGKCDIDIFSDCKSATTGGCNFCYPCINLGQGCKTITDNGYTLNPGDYCPGQLITKDSAIDKGICNSLMGINPSKTGSCTGSHLYVPNCG